MKKRRLACIFIIIGCLISVSFEYFSQRKKSYDRYLSGEYYFRYSAHTINIHKNDTWWATEEAQNTDYSDPKNMLKMSSNAKVWVCNPHNGLCTVYYGKETIIEDYNIADLQLDDEDTGYFYGTKKYTLKEYTEILKGMTKDELKSKRVSTKNMARFVDLKTDMLMMAAIALGIAFVSFILYKHEMDFGLDLTLFCGAGYSIFFWILVMVMVR